MILCTAYIKFVPEIGIHKLPELMDLGIQFYKHDTTSAKTEVLSLSDCQKEVYTKKEIILFGVGNWRSYTLHEAHAIIAAITKKIAEKFDGAVIEEKYEVKVDTPTE
ncbi:hypothetical protein J6T21_03865 [Candidatus Saccharibacteria bacterium]|nr:hypothetical protein [Candidatus Saccharibacteria bacterium]